MLDHVRYKVYALRHRYYLGAGLAALLGVTLTLLAPQLVGLKTPTNHAPIKVGVLHSLSGTMAVSEQTVADATLYAIEELNSKGGVLGRQVQPVLVDGKSDWDYFADRAEYLITERHVSAVFGCWTSACRKTVKPVFEKHDHVLFYPVQYEGLEQSQNIIYTGAAPNQQIIPATKWVMDNLGRRVLLVGSDYVFPRTAHALVRAQVDALQGDVVAETYVPLGGDDFSKAIALIRYTQPDVIINTINGDSNIAFYQQLRAAGIYSNNMPVMSFSLAETEIRAIGPELVAGDYAARNYFQTVNTPANDAFKRGFQAKFGADYVTTAPMEAAYFGVQVWAKAVEEAGSADYRDFSSALLGQSMTAPSGIIYIDPYTRHTWRTVLIGQARADGDFDVVWSSGRAVRPVPYPALRPKSEWARFLESLKRMWAGHWAAQTIDEVEVRDE